MLFVSSKNRTFPTVLGQKTLQKYKYISVALQREALWGKVCPLARWEQEEKERFPRMTGRALPGAPSSGTSANTHRSASSSRIITTMRENKQTNNGLQFSQLCFFFFFFSSLNRSACVQGVPCRRPGGGSEQESSRRQLPRWLWGHGDGRRLGVGSSLAPRTRHCACAWGELLFGSGEEAVLALTNVSCPGTSLHTPRPDYIHSIYTHTLARGDKERATVPLPITRQCHGNKQQKKN